MEIQQEQYLGYNCLRLTNGRISAWLAQDFGLRLIGLELTDQENVLVHLPEAHIEVKGGPGYQLRGGHRLWYGPEVPEVTYQPDNQPVTSKVDGDFVEQRQPIDKLTGVEKSWRIRLDPESAKMSIDHWLRNAGGEPVTLAPWAITMLKPGGLGIFPQQVEFSDPNGLQPNRHLVLWPYTSVQSEFIRWMDEVIFLRAAMQMDALKIGFPNPTGWLAYLLDDLVFIKNTDFDPTAEYIDRGASSQVYCSPDAIELETLGPKVQLQPGDTVEHREVWELYLLEDCRDDVKKLHQQYSTG